jgi:hypothetical protein
MIGLAWLVRVVRVAWIAFTKGRLRENFGIAVGASIRWGPWALRACSAGP